MQVPIDPKRLIAEISVSDLCQTAEAYYRNLSDPTHQMAKPFANILETPILLYKMGLLLSGLRLGKTMTVLDFGAGTCWFSRLLNQLQCATISVDVSSTGLELGRRLFATSPIVGEYIQPPQFIPFDGEHLEIADATVDRIVCFDTFHHVPNQHQVLREFFRVLKPGGIVGFSEPGIHHSQQPQSQYEMRNFSVLENDILLDEINILATEVGFRDLRVKLFAEPSPELSYADYMRIIRWPPPLKRALAELYRNVRTVLRQLWERRSLHQLIARDNELALPLRILNIITPAMQTSTVFFFTKGTFMPDSRAPYDLQHSLELVDPVSHVRVGESLEITLQIKNVGRARWLHHNFHDFGVVKVGVHLFDGHQQLVENDFARGLLPADVLPGENIQTTVTVTFNQPGEYILGIDMVAELIGWFEVLGNQPQYLHVTVI
ncbi:MAG: class I SAM-dependent methyltransferase [Anaerolineae bacterium]|nr:class I SAM-dependent methyltransferase [Anaerolineae bacterium]